MKRPNISNHEIMIDYTKSEDVSEVSTPDPQHNLETDRRDNDEVILFREKVARQREKSNTEKVWSPRNDKREVCKSSQVEEIRNESYQLAVNLGNRVKELTDQLDDHQREIKMLRFRHPKQVLEELDSSRNEIKKIHSENKKRIEDLQAELDAATLEIEYLRSHEAARNRPVTPRPTSDSSGQVDDLKKRLEMLAHELDVKNAKWREDSVGKYAILKHVSDQFIEFRELHIEAQERIANYEEEINERIKTTKLQNVKLRKEAVDALQLAFEIGERAKEIGEELTKMKGENNAMTIDDSKRENNTLIKTQYDILLSKYKRQNKLLENYTRMKSENKNWITIVATQAEQTKELAENLYKVRKENEYWKSQSMQLVELVNALTSNLEETGTVQPEFLSIVKEEVPALFDADTISEIMKSFELESLTQGMGASNEQVAGPEDQMLLNDEGFVSLNENHDHIENSSDCYHQKPREESNVRFSRLGPKLDTYVISVKEGGKLLLTKEEKSIQLPPNPFVQLVKKKFLCDNDGTENDDSVECLMKQNEQTKAHQLKKNFFCNDDDLENEYGADPFFAEDRKSSI